MLSSPCGSDFLVRRPSAMPTNLLTGRPARGLHVPEQRAQGPRGAERGDRHMVGQLVAGKHLEQVPRCSAARPATAPSDRVGAKNTPAEPLGSEAPRPCPSAGRDQERQRATPATMLGAAAETVQAHPVTWQGSGGRAETGSQDWVSLGICSRYGKVSGRLSTLTSGGRLYDLGSCHDTGSRASLRRRRTVGGPRSTPRPIFVR
jgi:hypothetical protein